MKEVDISEFKANCSALIKQVQKTKKPIRIMRFGETVAEIVPYSRPPASWMGSMKGKMEILGDIVSPACDESDWEVLKD